MTYPADRRYTRDHEWIAVDGDVATVGITSYAAEALGDVVYLDLPEVGTTVTAGESCGEIESTKSVSDLIAPATGEVLSVNTEAVDAPESVNADPHGEGWLYTVRVGELPEDLLDAEAYAEQAQGQQ
ncbi:glycine cleavage system protein GcvH [Georgenia thermotolerans]|uniref:Glycine cleavage system H protein n=1 Tax=Georgenia thermotolerans TaxID=527326 RepID=A0A7J5UP55_9MICO|nr:glycine cleavage system protein GcvH [Georgenia thermotolerans]KAE8764188.1 glycine cleavage system protein GcvH [Georgenia thermotolerans]